MLKNRVALAHKRPRVHFLDTSEKHLGTDQENAMKGLEAKKNFGHQNCQKSEFDDSRS